MNNRPNLQLIGGFFALLFLCQCATKKDTEFLNLSASEAEKTLDIDQEKLNKFQVVKTKENNSKKALAPKKNPKPKLFKKKSLVKTTDKKQEKALVKFRDKASVSLSLPKKDYPEKVREAFAEYDQTSEEVWKKINPLVRTGESFTFKVGYLGLTVGHIKMETMPKAMINEKEVFHFKANMRSARYYSYIYTLDDSIESFVSVDDFAPMKYVLLQRESAQTVDDLQLFDRDELKTFHFYKRLKKGKRTKREIEKPIPYYFQDSFSALHFVRGFPMEKGDVYKFPIVTRGKIWILEIKVEGTEEIEVLDQKIKAIRLNAETRFPGVLEKKGDILFWYSADNDKKLLKFNAEVKIGSVSGELVEYKNGKND